MDSISRERRLHLRACAAFCRKQKALGCILWSTLSADFE
jgi:hypothetical protein